MKRLTGLVLLGLGSALSAEPLHNAAELASFRAVAFGNVRSASVAKILDPQKHEMAEPSKNLFHGFALVSRWQTVDPDSRLQLTGILRTPLLPWVKTPFCLPDPGYAIHMETDEGPRDFVICLECDQITVYGKDQSRAVFSVEDDPLAQLKKNYQKAFHD